MSQVKHSVHGLSTPCQRARRMVNVMVRAEAEARPEDVGDQALMRGLDTA